MVGVHARKALRWLLLAGVAAPGIALADTPAAPSGSVSVFAVAQTAPGGQTATTTGQTAATQPIAVGAIVVTANKREELLRNVAQSVTAIPAQQVEQLQAFNFADYAKLVPGLSIVESQPGDTQLVLRGLNSGGVAATVATYIDETPYGSSSGLANGLLTTPDLDAFDMQRVEVLRGPQGTLYGASSIGGLLKFVTNPPDPSRFAAEGEVSADDVEDSAGWSVKGMLNIPLGNTAAIRIDGGDTDYPGYINDPFRNLKDVNHGGEQDGRVSLLWRPTSTLSFRLTAIAQNFETNDSNEVDIAINPATGAPLDPITPLYGGLDNAREVSGFNHVQDRLYNGTATWNMGWANLVSSTSYGTYASQSLADVSLYFDLGLEEAAQLTMTKFTEEDRLESPSGQPFEWLAGVFYTRETAGLDQQLIGESGSPYGAGTLAEALHAPSAFEETAGFATVTYHFTPQFDVAVGGRYAHNDQTSNEAVDGTTLVSGSSSDSSFTYSVAPRWKPNDDTTVYARIASGYQPGGPNLVPVTGAPAGFPLSFGPDTDVSYEVGVKQDLLDHTFSFDIDAFFIDWNHIQLLEIIDATGVDANGGRAQSDGIEGQAVYRPITGLTFSANATYTDARLTSNAPAVGGASGDPLPYAPELAGTLDGVYNWPLTGEVTAFVGATWSYVGIRDSSFNTTFGQVKLPAYSTFDLRAGVNVKRNWTVEVFAKNIGDARGISSLGDNPQPGRAAGQATPAPTLRARA